MSSSLVESEGQNLITWGCWRLFSAFLLSKPTLSCFLFWTVAEVLVVGTEASLSLFVLWVSLKHLSSVIAWTLIWDLYWYNLCNSVFECSVEVFPASWELAASALGLKCANCLNGLLSSLCPWAVTACTVIVCGSRKNDPDPPSRIPAGSCCLWMVVLDIDIKLIMINNVSLRHF